MKAMKWMLMLVFTALVLAGVKGEGAKASEPPCWGTGENGNHSWAEWPPATGWDDGVHYNQAATCEKDGWHWVFCEECCYYGPGDMVFKKITDKALGHAWNEKTESVTPATCTKDGHKDSICTRCQTPLTETIKAPGHDFSVKVKTVAPTCKGQGYTEYKCS